MSVKHVVLLVLLLAHSCHSSDTVIPYKGSQVHLRQLQQQEDVMQEDTAGLVQPLYQPASSSAAAGAGSAPAAASAAEPLLDATTAAAAAAAAAAEEEASITAATSATSQDPNSALQTLLQAQLSMPEEILALGFKPLASLALRNWRRFARRLSTPGANVTIAAFGSQVTMGHQGDSLNGSWVEELEMWLQVRRPGAGCCHDEVLKGQQQERQ
jgi:hypothetical protein